MKNFKSRSLASQPYEDQIITSHNGLTLEVCQHEESLLTAFRLRYRSYLSVNSISENHEELLYDHHDFIPNSRVFLVWSDGMPVATVRSCIFSDAYNWMPTEGIKYFGKELSTQIDGKIRVLESNRFAVDPDFQGRQSLYAQLLLFKAHGLNAGFHGCSYIITSVRANHRAFYLRFLGMTSITPRPVFIPWANAEVYLLGNDTDKCLQAILKRGMPNYDQQDIEHYRQCAKLMTSVGQEAA